MRCALLLPLLLTAAHGEEWSVLEKDWRAALAKYDQLAAKARSAAELARIHHPFCKFHDRLGVFARGHANAPEAGPALVEVARFTKDRNERVQALVQLRENHLRSPRIVALIPALTRLGDADCKRTLRDIAGGSPSAQIRLRAKFALQELKRIRIGERAWETLGETTAGEPVLLSDLRGKVIVVAIGTHTGLCRLRRRYRKAPLAVLVTGKELKDNGMLKRRWNALDSPRLMVIDHKGTLVAKDLRELDLRERVQELVEAAG